MVLLFLGEKWFHAILPLKLLALMMPFRMIANFLPSATDALGHPEIGVKNVFLAALVMPISLLIGVQWGIIGVAVVWVTVYPIILFINYHRSLSIMGLNLNDLLRILAPVMVTSVGMYGIVWGIDLLLGNDINKLIKLITMIIAGALVYWGLTLKFNRTGYFELINLFRKRN